MISHAASLRGIAVRAASGVDDPFHPGVEELFAALPAGSVRVSQKGCHTDSFFLEQEPASLAFLSATWPELATIAPSNGARLAHHRHRTSKERLRPPERSAPGRGAKFFVDRARRALG